VAAKKRPDPVVTVGAILQSYADRAVFRGFSGAMFASGAPAAGGRAKKALFKILWHRDRTLDFIVDASKGTLHIPLVLPQVPLRSEMYRKFKAFIAERGSKEMLPHRRIDPRKARVACSNKAGNVSVTLTVRGGDYEYGTQKMIHLIHEVFLTFLQEYFDYQVEVFELGL
jgi:hypothetical protein